MMYRLAVLSVLLISACGTPVSPPDDRDMGTGVSETQLGSVRILSCPQTATLVENKLTGYACYADQLVTANGSVSWQEKPIRYARVEILNNANDSVLLSGSTDNAGYYEFDISGLPGGDLFRVRAVSEGAITGSYSKVMGENAYTYAVSNTTTFSVTASGVERNIVAGTDVTGQVFNAFDQIIKTHKYLIDTVGISTPVPLEMVWYDGNASGSYYCGSYFDSYPYSACPTGTRLYILGTSSDSDGYDDDVVLHELGHYALDHYSRDDSPGGLHYLDGTNQDIRLSWSEGFATAFGSAVQAYAGDSSPDQYLDTDGRGNYFIEYYLEGPSGGVGVSGPAAAVYGIASEFAVSVALWDILDTAAEGFDSVSAPNSFWSSVQAMASIPDPGDVSFQNFYDHWTGNGYANLTSLLGDRKIFLDADIYEPDDSSGAATSLLVGTQDQQHTLLNTDSDWYVMTLNSGIQYVIDTYQEYNGARTRMTLYQSDGVTLVDDVAGNNPSTYFSYTPGSTGTYYMKVDRDPSSFSFVQSGSYMVKLTAP